MVLFHPPFYFVFYISNLLSYIQNNFSYELARPIMGTIFLVESERSERSEHIVVVSSRFYYIYIYSVTKILRKIRATTFTERLRKITREGERLG